MNDIWNAADQHLMNRVSSTNPDLAREAVGLLQYNPGKKLLAALRDYQRAGERKTLANAVRRASAIVRHRIWSTLSGADIPLNSKIAGGLLRFPTRMVS